jgi:tRNA(Ile)-lysidine synthase
LKTDKNLNTIIKESIEKNGLYGKKMTIAVSGGADSIALLYSIVPEIKNNKIEIFGAHLNHGLRGKESDEDENFVTFTFKKLKLPLEVKKIDISKEVLKQKTSLENAGRNARHDFLYDVSQKYSTDLTALGHTFDDQAETILLNLIRGSGLNGISGMKELSTRILNDKKLYIYRPFLHTSKMKLEDYLKKENLAFNFDSTNNETDYRRNALRIKVFPILEKYNPKVKRNINRLAETVAKDLDFIETQLIHSWNKTAVLKDNMVSINTTDLLKLHPSISLRLLKKAIAILKGNEQDIYMTHINSLMKIANGPSGKQINLPGQIIAKKNYGELIICFDNTSTDTLPLPAKNKKVRLTGITRIPGWDIRSTLDTNNSSNNTNNYVAYLSHILMANGLYVRSRKSGDRLYMKQNSTSKKLQDYMVDQKIPRICRDKIPLITTNDEKIAWIVGYRIAEWAKPENQTKSIKITFTKTLS